MNTPAPPHDEFHEDLLHEHLSGDLPAGDDRLVRLLSSCPTCETRLAELRSMTDLLARVGRDERRALTDLPEETSVPGADLVAPTLRALAAGQAPPRPRPQPRPTRVPAHSNATLWRVSLAAASVLAAGWLVKTLLPAEQTENRDMLLGKALEAALTPEGTVTAFGQFSWDGLEPRAVWYELRIWAADQSTLDEPLVRIARYTTHWLPTEQEARDLPDEIYWEITGYNEQGTAVAFADARAIKQTP